MSVYFKTRKEAMNEREDDEIIWFVEGKGYYIIPIKVFRMI